MSRTRRQAALRLLVGLAFLAGCSDMASRRTVGGGETRPSTGLISSSDRVLVIPFRDGSCLPVDGNQVTCHLTGEHFEAGNVPKGTGTDLAGILFQDLQARGTALIPFQQSVALLSQADPALVDSYEPALAVDLGNRAGATKAIMGVMIRYEERSGSWFGSRDPAAVAFSLALIEVSSGAIIHRLRFDRRQAPLTTNLLALPLWWQEGFRWWTRREVAERALAEATDALVGTAGTATPSLETNWPSLLPARDQGSAERVVGGMLVNQRPQLRSEPQARSRRSNCPSTLSSFWRNS